MKNRRDFIKQASLGALGLSLMPNNLFAENDLIKLTILHTNDMHSHIEPFTSGRNKGLGGMAERAALIKKIREDSEHVLLLDAGDIFQGTPYFNMYGGELEFKLMSKMKYDAATIGNHDFDNGLDGLKSQLPFADFPFLCANYDFSDSILNGQFKPYKIFKKAAPNLILSGDVCYFKHPNFFKFFTEVSKLYQYIFYIPGNHEFYTLKWTNFNYQIYQLRGILYSFEKKLENLKILDRHHVTIDNYIITSI